MFKNPSVLCTFAYAVTRRSAQKILHNFAPAREPEARNIPAYDLVLRMACGRPRNDPWGLACSSVLPELLHHFPGRGTIDVENVAAGDAPPVDSSVSFQQKVRQESTNIECGFMSGEFYHEGNEAKKRWLRNEVVG